MQWAALKVKDELLTWNEEVLDERSFHSFCESRGVLVVEANMKWRGLYMVRRSIPVILINKSLQGLAKLNVQWHEIGHHLLHAPAGCFFNGNSHHKTEMEAFMVSACALIPRPMVIGLHPAEIAEHFNYSAKIISFRYYIFRTYNI